MPRFGGWAERKSRKNFELSPGDTVFNKHRTRFMKSAWQHKSTQRRDELAAWLLRQLGYRLFHRNKCSSPAGVGLASLFSLGMSSAAREAVRVFLDEIIRIRLATGWNVSGGVPVSFRCIHETRVTFRIKEDRSFYKPKGWIFSSALSYRLYTAFFDLRKNSICLEIERRRSLNRTTDPGLLSCENRSQRGNRSRRKRLPGLSPRRSLIRRIEPYFNSSIFNSVYTREKEIEVRTGIL